MNKVWIGLSILAMVAVLAFGVAAFPGIGFGMNQNGVSDEQKQFMEDMQDAIANKDYEAWKSLMESKLTEEHFNALVEQHSKIQEMQDLKEQLRQARRDKDAEKIEELESQLDELMPMGMKGGPKDYGVHDLGKRGCMR